MTGTDFRFAAGIALIGGAFLCKLWIAPGIVYSENSDIISHHVAFKAAAHRSWNETRAYPLWHSSNNCGMPAHANPAALFAFPFHWPYWVMSLERATNLMILLNYLCAGLSMFLLARRWLRRRAAAFFCAIAYMLCYPALSMIDSGAVELMTMYALAPLLFWAFGRLSERPGIGRLCGFSIVLALALSQGHMQTLYYNLLALACAAAFGVVKARPGRRWGAPAALAAAGGLAALLAAPDLLPRLEFSSWSTRSTFNYAFFLNHAPSWGDLKTWLDPMDGGGHRDEYWVNNFYCGLWLPPLFLFACVKGDRRARLGVCAALALTFLCFDTPLLKLLYEFLPGFNLFRIPSRILLLVQLILVVAAGWGLEALLASRDQRSIREFAALLTLAGAGGLLGAAFWHPQAAYAPAGLTALAGASFYFQKRCGRSGLALLCLLVIFDSGWRLWPRIATWPLDRAFPSAPLHEALRSAPGSGRTAAIGRTSVPYGMAGYYGIDMINGYEALNLRHYIEYFAIMEYGGLQGLPKWPVVWTDIDAIARPDMLRALDARTIIANKRYPLDGIGYEFAAAYPDVPVFHFYRGIKRVPVYLWRDSRPLGAAYFSTSVRAVANERASLDALVAAASVRDAFVLGLDRLPNAAAFLGGTAEMIKRGANDYVYNVKSEGENFLIFSQIWYPGWRLSLDGRETKLYRTNHALVGCFVPSGAHTLELTMTSPKLRQGIILFCFGLILMACLLVWDYGKGRRNAGIAV